LEITVNDTGIGIPSDHIEKLFLPFNQADGSSTRQFGGTGLGLNICKHLLDLMHGSIQVTSVVGGGSTFTVVLPCKAVVKADKAPDTDKLAVSEKTVVSENVSTDALRHIRILLVEDNSTNQFVAQSLLEEFDCDVLVANHGLEAVEMVQKDRFDLILMDCQMPIMDGYEATQKIRAFESNHPEIPPCLIVAMTANALPEDKEKCLAVGMNDFIAKPVEYERIAFAIKQACHGQS
jgi:CheY-like chemotaxis protein